MPHHISSNLRRRIIDAALAAERDSSEELSVSTLAEFAEVSDKHFQRCFRQIIGESPKSYVRRLRLQKAAYLLKWSDIPVINIAMRAGFSTHAGFTKAFVRAYSLSPQQFRESRDVMPYLFSRETDVDPTDFNDLAVSRLIVRVQQQPDWRVAAMRHIGPTEKIAEVWPRMIAWADGRSLLNEQSILLGIHNDYWDTNAEDKYRYDAAIVVPSDFTSDDEVNAFSIPAGEIAMTEFSGSLSQADVTWGRFVDQWLPVSGYQFRANFVFDHYPVELVTGGRLQNILQTLVGIRATFCIPVKK